MSLILRKITNNRWFNLPNDKDIAADPVTDLKTEKNNLSVFCFDEEEASSHLETIITGIATTRDINKVEYALIKKEDIENEGFIINPEVGETASEEANLLHYNIANLSGKSLVKLASIINQKAERNVKQKKEVKILLKKAFDEGKLSIEKINVKDIKEFLAI